jgi:ATPase subunit of ABC transporter with duplicated ATPase domains
MFYYAGSAILRLFTRRDSISMTLITLHHARLAFGAATLLDDVFLTLRERERVCLLGRNGAGKSTLMRVIQDDVALDGGEIMRRQGLRTALVAQPDVLLLDEPTNHLDIDAIEWLERFL